MNKQNLNELFFKYSGIYFDIENEINNLSDTSEKIKLFERLSWHLKRGVITDQSKGLTAETYAELLNMLAETCGLESSEEIIDIDKDGDIDMNDEKILNDLNHAEDILSSLNIETNPSEEPSIEPSNDEE